MTTCKTYNDKRRTYFCALDSLCLMDEMTKSTAADNCHIYIETGLSPLPVSQPPNLPDMCWLAPLVVRAFVLRTQMLGEDGEPPKPYLIDEYNGVIGYIAMRLVPLPLSAMEMARQVATDSIWIDIADAVAAHYK